MSLDGKIALGNGDSKWITEDLARRYGHVERLKHDAILTGSGTVSVDNPKFTVRLGGEDITKPIYILSSSQPSKNLKGVNTNDLNATLEKIASDGINNLYIEGGAKITTSFLKSGLVDRLLVFRAAKIIGDEGLSAFGDLDISDMQNIYKLNHIETRRLGADTLDIYTRCSQD